LWFREYYDSRCAHTGPPITTPAARSSTLENWVREFQRFAPDIDVQTYYGSQKEREEQRYHLKTQHRNGELEVLITTYDLAFRQDDQKFLKKKLEFEASGLSQSF
jgi:SNF2 family DNA or RNA helicase